MTKLTEIVLIVFSIIFFTLYVSQHSKNKELNKAIKRINKDLNNEKNKNVYLEKRHKASLLMNIVPVSFSNYMIEFCGSLQFIEQTDFLCSECSIVDDWVDTGESSEDSCVRVVGEDSCFCELLDNNTQNNQTKNPQKQTTKCKKCKKQTEIFQCPIDNIDIDYILRFQNLFFSKNYDKVIEIVDRYGLNYQTPFKEVIDTFKLLF